MFLFNVSQTNNPHKSPLQIYGKVIALLMMMVLGVLLPQYHTLSFLIQYLLMAMLFFAFLDLNLQPGTFSKRVILVVLANIGVAFLGYWGLSMIDLNLALVAFITGIAPTAIASPVIIGFLNGKVEFAAGAVLLSNVVMALIVPVTLPLIAGREIRISTWDVLLPVLLTMFIPMLLARLVAYLPRKTQSVIRAGKRISFPLWLANLFIICAKAADFAFNESSYPVTLIAQIALVSLGICVLNFAFGALLGGRSYWQEASQALGQKNNSFAIWIALTFINPLVAMGPTFYVLYHNVYNAWQIYRFEKQRDTLRLNADRQKDHPASLS